MRVLVTGAAGMLGAALVTDLAGAGHEVVALVLPGQEDDAGQGASRVVGADATDPDQVRPACDGVEAVAHLAAIPSPVGPGHRVFATNTQATYVVLDEAGRAGARRVVLASSLSALGLAWGRRELRPAYLPLDEDHPDLSEDPYALSKQVDERTAATLHRRWGIDVLCVRMPFVGSGDRMAEHLAQARSDPGSMRQEVWAYLHTDDAVAAFRAGVEGGWAGCHVVDVAAADTMSPEPTEDLVRRWLPEVPLRRRAEGTAGLVSTDRARDLLGWQARWSWRDASADPSPAHSPPTP